MHPTVQRDDVLEAWAFCASSRKTGAHRHCGEQVASNTLTPEGLDAKCEQGEKMSVRLQIDEIPEYLRAEFIGAGATEEIERQFESLAKKRSGVFRNMPQPRASETPHIERHHCGLGVAPDIAPI